MKFRKVILPILIVIASLFAIYLGYTLLRQSEAQIENKNNNSTVQPAVEDINAEYVNSIGIQTLSIQKCQTEISNKNRYGFRFVLTYIFPQNKAVPKDLKLGLQITYPDEYFNAIGCNASGIEYSYPYSLSNQTPSSIFEVYPDNISEELIDTLISTQYEFGVDIFSDDSKEKTVYILNSTN